MLCRCALAGRPGVAANGRGPCEEPGCCAGRVHCCEGDRATYGGFPLVGPHSWALYNWERLHQLAVAEGVSLQEIMVRGLSQVFTSKGLPGIGA